MQRPPPEEEKKMYYYYVIRDGAPTYTIVSKKGIAREDLHDKKAKYIVPVSFLQWIYLSLKFKTKRGEKRI